MLDRLGETGVLQMRVVKSDSSLSRELDISLQDWLLGDAEPDILGSLGITPVYMDIPPRIGQLEVGGRAAMAGIESGDLVLTANGINMAGWDEWVTLVRDNPETDLAVTLDRSGRVETLVLRPAVRLDDSGNPQLDQDGRTQGYIGAGVELPVLPQEMIRTIQFSPIAALGEAVSETWENSIFVLVAIKKMIIGLMSVNNISGPITIAQIAGDTASNGLEYFIGFLAILSISLGVMNLLPIPVLDGGHLFYYAIEAIIRKPLPEGVQEMGLRFGLLVIAGIMFIAFYNDINRLL
jgi:regulator of sigma E protease